MTDLTDATFYAPLKTTLVPTNGSGNPTFTRATTKNVFDNEGNLKTLKSGAVAMAGARVVHNWCQNKSEDITHSSWAVNGGGTKPSANLFVCASATIAQYISTISASNAVKSGEKWLATYRVEYIDIRYLQIFGHGTAYGFSAVCNFDLVDGDYTATGCTASMTAVSSGVWDISVLFTVIADFSNGYTIIGLAPSQTATRAQSFVGDGIKSVGVLRFQLENVTGQADQTASEYVSVGVLSAPYHGSGADGVKYFSTNKDLTAIPDATMLGAHIDPASKTNNLLYCRDLAMTGAVVPRAQSWFSNTRDAELVTNPNFDSNITGWTNSSEAGGSISWDATGYIDLIAADASGNTEGIAYQVITTVAGEWYTIECDRTTNPIIVQTGTGIADNGKLCQSTNSSGLFSANFRALTTSTYVTLRNHNFAGTSKVNSVSVKLANIISALSQTGITGVENSCSLLTAAAANAVILQKITAASTLACSGFWVKRSVGTGSIYITRDGGTAWTDITSLINSSTFTCVKIENTSVTNPSVGFKIATSGDAIIVDAGLNHAGTQLCEPIFTTTAAVTRNAEVLTYQTASNFSNTAGTVLATFRPTYDTWPSGSIVGKVSFGLLASTANSGVQAADGTNTVSGAAGSTLAGRKIGMKWLGSALKAFAGGVFGTAGSYDGSFNLTTVGINAGAAGYIRDVAIWTSSLSDADMLSAACDKADLTSAIACTAVMIDAVIYASVMSSAVNCDAAIYNNVTNSVSMSAAVACDVAIFNNIINSVYMISAISIESIFDGISETGSESPANITIHAIATYADVARIGVYANVARNGTYSSMQINADYP